MRKKKEGERRCQREGKRGMDENVRTRRRRTGNWKKRLKREAEAKKKKKEEGSWDGKVAR